ncbi:MAG: DUF2249 domain-containing protein [Magnetospirillum sp.]|nr:DUF2249 domain-containing protein [Magnetospirillum sp.]
MRQNGSAGGDESCEPPRWLGEALHVEPFDVRSLLASGGDPFFILMERAANVDFGRTFTVDAPFNPAPLRVVLAGQGFSSYGCKLAEGHWRVYFRRDGGPEREREAEVGVPPGGDASRSEAGMAASSSANSSGQSRCLPSGR